METFSDAGDGIDDHRRKWVAIIGNFLSGFHLADKIKPGIIPVIHAQRLIEKHKQELFFFRFAGIGQLIVNPLARVKGIGLEHNRGIGLRHRAQAYQAEQSQNTGEKEIFHGV